MSSSFSSAVQIDSRSKLLHAEEHNYKTAYSCFYEAFERSSSLDDLDLAFKLKYMLLCKIMARDSADVPLIVNSKVGLKYLKLEVDAMRLWRMLTRKLLLSSSSM